MVVPVNLLRAAYRPIRPMVKQSILMPAQDFMTAA
jgi:hypothetical protein